MAKTINKLDIKLKKSQRLDDTTQGGGQMIADEVISGKLNELYPDISRLDRVYGRVSMRKAFLSIDTSNQETYYGAHVAITEDAKDPNVSCVFFSSTDWFDTRDSARSRVEGYLVQGPFYPAALWGNVVAGSRAMTWFTSKNQTAPEIGDVLILMARQGTASETFQFFRIKEISEYIFEVEGSPSYTKKIIDIEMTDKLSYDFAGEEISNATNYTRNSTVIYSTVAADASQYFGVAQLVEDVNLGELRVRVDSTLKPLVPSAQSAIAIPDAGVGNSVNILIQSNDSMASVVRSISFKIETNSSLYIGEGVLPGSFSWSGGLPMRDDATGNVLSGDTIIGSIEYNSGILSFSQVSGSYSGTGVATYLPAANPITVSNTGFIDIATNNRNFVYVFNCNPLPKPGSVKVDFLAAGKWYSIQDVGDGTLKGTDPSIGSGSVNYITGSISISLGYLPDVGSRIIIYWSKNAQFYDLSGETIQASYEFELQEQGVAKGSFVFSWKEDSFAIVDNGSGKLTVGQKSGDNWIPTTTEVGEITYATGKVKFQIHSSQEAPLYSEKAHIEFSYGDFYSESFNPIRNANGTVTFTVNNPPIRPNTFDIEWHTDLEVYYVEDFDPADPSTAITSPAQDLSIGFPFNSSRIDPTHIYKDNGVGGFEGEASESLPPSILSTINYTAGTVNIMPDRIGVFPQPVYENKTVGVMTEGNPGANATGLIFSYIVYLPGGSIFPIDGVLMVNYMSQDGDNSMSYNEQHEKKFYIRENSSLEILVGSISFYCGEAYIIERSGVLYRDVDGRTGTGIECGTVDYVNSVVTLKDDTLVSSTIQVRSCTGRMPLDPVQLITFRTPGAPLVPGSFSIRATLSDGSQVSATSDFSGNLDAPGIIGKVTASTGIVSVAFGAWLTDEWKDLPEKEKPMWYIGAVVDGDDVWRPYSVDISSIFINCVISTYIPLDANLLGLDPVRLPSDGKVPIFRDGNIILIHNTKREELPNPIVPGNTYTASRSNLNSLEIYDSDGTYVPEMTDSIDNYTVPVDDNGNPIGTVTFGASFDALPYTQPLYMVHRIEDMTLLSDVQITGHMAITSPLTHSYLAEETLVSSVFPIGDMQSRAYNEFSQSTWTGVWSDDIIGSVPLAQYDFLNYPLMVTNRGATKERWLILFKTITTIDIIGEHLGVRASNVSISGSAGGIISVRNPLTGEIYFQMNEAGFGSGWAAGNCIRFNTDASNYPLWFVRTTLQAPATEKEDSFKVILRGDHSTTV